MRVTGIKDVEAFIKVIDSCSGRVELVTAEGDRLNLKSRLARYVSLSRLFADDSLRELEIIASEPEDVNKIIGFLMN